MNRTLNHRAFTVASNKPRVCLEAFGPNRDTLEYMLQHYKHLSVIDAVKQTKDDDLGSYLSP